MSPAERHPASFRDPSGFLFQRDGILYRQVNRLYREDYDRLVSSGLYRFLTDRGLLIPHQEVEIEPEVPADAYKVLRPEPVRFVSYPYEWCFGQLRTAALTTLEIQRIALEHGLWLKDASGYNIQFDRGKPILIDSLSFEAYPEGEPWVAYRQFCQHFLGPLALMALRDVRLSQLLRVYPDGLPLDLASRLLPRRSWWNPALMTHIHLHARAQARFAGRDIREAGARRRMGRTALLGWIGSLEQTVRRLDWKPAGTAWVEYYSETSYSEAGLEDKRSTVRRFLEQVRPSTVWDLGANTGYFSRVAAGLGIPTVALDVDPGAVERNYREALSQNESDLLPLWMDLTNPSPDLGWANAERMSLRSRGPAGLVMALALVHHLAIAGNVPLDRIADYVASLSPWLIVEFVPKQDSQVQRLLAARKDIFSDYSREGFERAFGHAFDTRACVPIQGTDRLLYLLQRRAGP